MGKIIVYIASSLDGYIAGKEDEMSWLEGYNATDEDYGYAEFIKSVGTAVMGARTYEQSLKHAERLMFGVKNYVLSDVPMDIPEGVDVEFYNGSLVELVERIKKESAQNVFVVGGGQVVSGFLNAGLVDELLHFVAPTLIKEGIRLYSALDKKIELRLIEAVPYKTGIVKLRYAPGEKTRV